MLPNKRTKIVCTIGPASHDPEMIEKMVLAGMNVARLNFSHGTHDDHAKIIATIRAVAAKLGQPIALLQDLQGPKIRVGDLPKDGIMLVKGELAVFSTGPADASKIPVTYDRLHLDVKADDVILLDDGLLEVKVEKVDGQDIITRVVNGGPLTSHKGFNLPTATLSIPAITDKDKEDLTFGVAQGVDWVALSFVRDAKEIHDLRQMIKDLEMGLGANAHLNPIHIMAKIEKHEAIRNIDEIIEAVDGIMVARGDLGIETPAEEVPVVQKRLIEKCLAAAKPVVVATQMLDSMIRNPRPTRAEVSDVANAVIDHADAVMLSGESASGKFPLEAVETMSRIIQETEKSQYDNLPPGKIVPTTRSSEAAMSEIANMLARGVTAKLILVATMSGETARLVSRHRAELSILAVTENERVRNQLTLSWGVLPFILPRSQSVEELVVAAVDHFKREQFAAVGDKIIVVAREPLGSSGDANVVELRDVV